MSGDHPLPSFERPPVNEVVLSVSFDRPAGFGIAHLGDFWHRKLVSDLRDVEEQAPYQPPVEVLSSHPAPPFMNLQMLATPPSPRLWAKSPDGTKLVQLQPNWFASNWRETAESKPPYPRWPVMEEFFLDYFHRFQDYLNEEGFGEVTPQQCEVSYINHIRPNPIWRDHSDIDKVLVLAGATAEFLPRPENLQLAAAYRIKTADGTDRGRLHVNAQPAFQREGNLPILVLTLVARGDSLSPDEDGMMEFFRLGHEWIVRGFAAITTPAMHEEWGRET
jgi:uncharacterized protein (TIGR04255 family)